MWASERYARIIELLDRKGRVLTVEAASQLDVSRETIRRDFLDMEKEGLLERVHGGAVSLTHRFAPEPAFAERRETNVAAKRAIGRCAASLIARDATIFVDAGTTTLAFANELARRSDIRIITNSIDIARSPDLVATGRVLLLGGQAHPDVPGTYGEVTLSEIERFRADYAVISPVGIHRDRGASDFLLNEAEVARAMVTRSTDNIFLCLSEKIGVESRVAICGIGDIHTIVLDTPVAQDVPGARVVVAEANAAHH